MAASEIADYCYEPVDLVKTVVLALAVAVLKVDPARVVETVVATVFGSQVLNRLVAKVEDWC